MIGTRNSFTPPPGGKRINKIERKENGEWVSDNEGLKQMALDFFQNLYAE